MALVFGIAFWAGSPPNHRIRLDREAVSERSIEQLGRSLSRYRRWNQWHHQVVDVRLVGQGPETEIAVGSIVRFQVEPKGKPWKKFELDAKVERYEPNHLIRLKLIRDSTNRILEQFDELSWEISFEEQPTLGGASPGTHTTQIHGSVEGFTRNWRSRLFSRIAPRILMNQVFYVDIFRLAGMDSASGMDLSPRE